MIVVLYKRILYLFADYIIDLGPRGGTGGGEIVAAGTPEEIAQNGNSLTGKALKEVLK